MFSKKAFMMVFVVIVVILSALISKSLRQVMRKHPLFFFFLLSYAFSWIISIPYVLSVWGILPGDYTIGLMLKQWMGPALAAIIMISIIEGRAGLLRLAAAAPHKTMARQLAVVSVHSTGHPGADFAWDHYPARSACQFSRSYSPLTGELSGVLCRRLLWGWAARGNWLAWLRVAPHATALWSIVEHTAPGCLVGFLAFAVLPDTGSWGRSRH